jgi:indolepyruvate decarboxylase
MSLNELSFPDADISTPANEITSGRLSIGQYLIQRLQDYGVGHVFGIPGDYVLAFYSMLEKSPLDVVGCTREDCAGFAADAYARVRGLGVVCVTYCVGGLSVCNSIAGAYAEKSPVVVISGSPGLGERINNPLLHHKVRDFHTQLEVFEKLCVAAVEISDPVNAFREIDRALDAAVRYKRPVYIELPRDMVHVIPHVAHTFHRLQYRADPAVIQEAATETAEILAKAERPVILAGVEIHRFGLQDKLVAFAEQTGIPIAATVLGKSVIGETHPLYIGLYEGAMGRQEVTEFVEQSDCVLILGAFMTDINLGVFTANLELSKCIYATSEQLRVHHHHYRGVALSDYLEELVKRQPQARRREIPPELQFRIPSYELQASAPIRISRLIARINQQLDEGTVVIADIGDSLFSATELVAHERTEFLSPAYYTSMGFSVPAALGAQTASPDSRVLVLVGDGAFQMTGMELSTVIRRGYAPIVIVLDNHGYGTERILHPGEWAFNEIHPWNYAALPQVLGGGVGHLVQTEGEFDQALREAWEDRANMHLIQVKLSVDDSSETLRRLAERLGQRVKGE